MNPFSERRKLLTEADKLWQARDELIDAKYFSPEPKDDGGAIDRLAVEAERLERLARELWDLAQKDAGERNIPEFVSLAHDHMGRM